MSAAVGTPVSLPETVTVTFADGSAGERAVVWDHVEPTLFDHAGVYTIHGTVEGRADFAVLTLTVE